MYPLALSDYVKQTYRRRKLKDVAMHFVLILAACVALLPLFSVLGYVMIKGIPGLSLSFFTELPKPVGESGGGMGNALLGTFSLVGLGSLIGVVWGVLAGVFLAEYPSGKVAHTVRFGTDMLASVPSIVVGLFVYAVLVAPLKTYSVLAGGVALGILMIPTVARSTEEMLRLVPVHIREAGLGLGLPRWKVIWSIVLRGSAGGIATGVILALARVAGETAPLLFTALGNSYWQSGIFEPTAALPLQIYQYAISPFEELHTLAWAGSLVLVLFVFLVNMVVRLWLKSGSVNGS